MRRSVQDPGTRQAVSDDVDPQHTTTVVADLTRAFLDQHLRGDPQALLDDPPPEARRHEP